MCRLQALWMDDIPCLIYIVHVGMVGILYCRKKIEENFWIVNRILFPVEWQSFTLSVSRSSDSLLPSLNYISQLGEVWNSRDEYTLSNSLSASRDTFWIFQGVPPVYYDVVNKRFEETARDIEKMANRRMNASRKLTCQLQVICTYARHYLMDKLPGGKYNEIWDFDTVSQQWNLEWSKKWSHCASFLKDGRWRVETQKTRILPCYWSKPRWRSDGLNKIISLRVSLRRADASYCLHNLVLNWSPDVIWLV